MARIGSYLRRNRQGRFYIGLGAQPPSQMLARPPNILVLTAKILDYCNSFYHNLPNFLLHRLQAPADSKLSCPHCFQYHKNLSHHSSSIASLHWLKIKERIEYKLFSLTYKILITSQTTYLHNLVSPQSPRGTCSSSIVTLPRPESRNARNLVS